MRKGPNERLIKEIESRINVRAVSSVAEHSTADREVLGSIPRQPSFFSPFRYFQLI